MSNVNCSTDVQRPSDGFEGGLESWESQGRNSERLPFESLQLLELVDAHPLVSYKCVHGSFQKVKRNSAFGCPLIMVLDYIVREACVISIPHHLVDLWSRLVDLRPALSHLKI